MFFCDVCQLPAKTVTVSTHFVPLRDFKLERGMVAQQSKPRTISNDGWWKSITSIRIAHEKKRGGVERVTTGLAMPCALSLALMLLAQHASAKKCTGRARQADQ